MSAALPRPGPLRRRRRFAVALAAFVASAATAATTAPALAAQRYAAPGATGTVCSADQPCDIDTAINSAHSGDEIIVASGSYSVSAPLSDGGGNQLNVHGAAGQPRPTITSGAATTLKLTDANSQVSGLEVDNSASQGVALLFGGTLAERLVLGASGAGGAAAELQASTPQLTTLRDALAVASGNGGQAVDSTATGTTTASAVRNVTAIATGSASAAVEAAAMASAACSSPPCPGSDTLTVVNTIARSTQGPDLLAQGDPASTAAISVDHSNFANMVTVGGGGHGGQITQGAGNQTTAPAFAGPGDYHEASASSSTIAKGITDAANGLADFEGSPRTLNATTDIGADEFRPPVVSTFVPDAVGESGAVLRGTVNPNGKATSYVFEYGPTTTYGSVLGRGTAGSGTDPVDVTATLTGLPSGTTYHYRLTATNASGTTTGNDQTFTTLTPTPAGGGGGGGSGGGSGGGPAPSGPIVAMHLASGMAEVIAGVADVEVTCTGPAGAFCRGSLTLQAAPPVPAPSGGRHATTPKKHKSKKPRHKSKRRRGKKAVHAGAAKAKRHTAAKKKKKHHKAKNHKKTTGGSNGTHPASSGPPVVVGSAAFDIDTGRTTTIAVPINAAGQHLLLGGALTGTAVFTFTSGGRLVTTRQTVSLAPVSIS